MPAAAPARPLRPQRPDARCALPAHPHRPCRRVYYCRSPGERAEMVREQLLAQASLSAALWLALKFDGSRSATPDSSLMTRLTGG